MIKYPRVEEDWSLSGWGKLSDKGINAATKEEWDLSYSEHNPSTCCPKVQSTGGSTSYYELPQVAKELQDLIEHKKMNYAVANMFKACYRLGQKEGNDDMYDLKKIQWFVNREIDRREE